MFGRYFADILSDVQVIQLLWESTNYVWSLMSLFLLVNQFFIVYLRCLPYLKTTFGSESPEYIVFLILGFPTGLLFLDACMFLEPFGLLAILPFPPWMRQFIPAYKATRVIAEILIESLPQSVLQGYIYVAVIHHSRDGTASPGEMQMLDEWKELCRVQDEASAIPFLVNVSVHLVIRVPRVNTHVPELQTLMIQQSKNSEI